MSLHKRKTVDYKGYAVKSQAWLLSYEKSVKKCAIFGYLSVMIRSFKILKPAKWVQSQTMLFCVLSAIS